jgi:DNA-binding LytR/AlgR family response regulator
MMKAIAVDDEPIALELIETYCRNFDFLSFKGGFYKTMEALRYLENNPVDLLFLDINMPAMSGIDFYRSLPHRPMLIFTTSYSHYALESYELDAIDYLLKPFNLARFERAVTKAYERHNLIHNAVARETTKFLMLKADAGLVKVMLPDILFIEGLDNYLRIHLADQPPVVIRMTMKALLENLNEKEFIRVHKSYIVPILRIGSMKQKTINVAGNDIPVGKNYEHSIKEMLKPNI